MGFSIWIWATNAVNAQCPTANFTLGVTTCGGQAAALTNTSTNATRFDWDFCTGEVATGTPTRTALTLTSPGFNTSRNISLYQDGANWYGFVANTNSITRLDFGTDPINTTPTATSLTNALIGALRDFKLIREGSNWVGLACGPFATNRVVRLEFGSSLANTPTYTNLTATYSAMTQPQALEIVREGSRTLVFFLNLTGSMMVYNLGSSLLNTPSLLSTTTITGSASPTHLGVVKVCNDWVSYVVNFTNSGGNSPLNRLVYSSGPATAATVSTFQIPNAVLNTPLGCRLIQDGGQHLLLAVNQSGSVALFNLGSDPRTGTPTQRLLIGNPASGNQGGIEAVQINSVWRAFTVTSGSNTVLNRLEWIQTCGATTASSTLTNPAGPTYTGTGRRFVQLIARNDTGGTSIRWDSTTLGAAPTVNFDFSGGNCGTGATQFTDQTTVSGGGSVASRSWDFAGLGSSTASNPQFTFPAPGSYGVKLRITANTGCVDSLTRTVVIGARPTAAFGFPGSICARDSFLFTESSTVSPGTVTGWSWNFGDGNTSTLRTPRHAFAISGSYPVRLIVLTSAGCRDTLTQTVNVIAKPVVNFAFDNSCVGESVRFTDLTTLSSGTITGRLWRFGDGNTSTQINPVHVYSATGTYNARLIVTTSGGCTDSITLPIRVGNKPVPVITAPSSLCAFTPIALNANASTLVGDTITTYGWRIGTDSLTGRNISYTFPAPGNYTVRLRVLGATACDSSTQTVLTVTDGPTTQFTNSLACPGQATQFTDLSIPPSGFTITSRSWNFANLGTSTAQNPSFTFPGTGTYAVTLTTIASNGCSSSVTRTVRVFANPTAAFTQSITGSCVPTTLSLNSTGTADTTIATYIWDLGTLGTASGASPSINVTQPGIYPFSLQVVTAVGCTSTVALDTLRLAGVNIDIPNSVCSGKNVVPINNSVGLGFQEWDFCSEPLTGTLNANTVTVNSGTFNDTRGMELVREGANWFGFICNANEGSLVRLQFGANLRNPSPLVDKLTNNLLGTGTGLVGPAGIRIYREGNNWYGLVVRIFSNAIIRLDFGTSLANTPTYTSLGNPGGLLANARDIALTVENNNLYALVSNFTSRNLSVFRFGSSVTNTPVPVANHLLTATNPSGMRGVRICGQFRLFVSDFGSRLYRVEFNNGMEAAPTSQTQLTAPAGSFTQAVNVSLLPVHGTWWAAVKRFDGQVVLANLGSNASANTVTVRNLTGFGFTSGSSIQLANDSSKISLFTLQAATPTVLTRLDLANTCQSALTYAQGSNPGTIRYATSGPRYIQFRARGLDGSEYLQFDSIVVLGTPKANFGFRQTCAGQPTIFTDSSSAQGGLPFGNQWDFGGLGGSTGSVAAFTFPGAGTYNVRLVFTNTNGCTDTITKPVEIGPLPGANITLPPISCARDTVQFLDVSNVSSGTIVAWRWTFGNGGTSTLQNPRFAYATPGTFNVKLVVTTALGCRDSITVPYTVRPKPIVNFVVDNSCVGETIRFINQTTQPGGGFLNFRWDFGGQGTSQNQNPTFTFTTPGTYNIKLVATGQFCSDSLTIPLIVGSKPVPVITAPSTACQFNPITFSGANSTLAGDTIRQYIWYFGNDSLIGKTVTYSFQNSGIQTYRLRTIGGTACDSVRVNTITIQAAPRPGFRFNNVCIGGLTTLTDTSTPAASVTSRLWLIDNQSPITGQQVVNTTFAQPGTYRVILEVGNGTCSARDTEFVQVYALPVASFTFGGASCPGDTLVLQSTSTSSSAPIVQYQWNLGALGSYGSPNLSIPVNNSGQYLLRLRVTDANLCQSIERVETLNINGSRFSLGPDELCEDAPFTLTNISAGPVAQVWDFCSGDFRFNPVGNTVTVQPNDARDARAMRIVKDQGIWYSFHAVPSSGLNRIVRIAYGADPRNPNPTVTNLSNNTLLPSPVDIELVNDNGTWYGFSVNLLSNRIIRLNFGSSLGNTPTFTDLGNPSDSLSSTIAITHLKENGQHYLLVSNFSNQRVSLVRLGANITGTPQTLRNLRITRQSGTPQIIRLRPLQLCGVTRLFLLDQGNAIHRMDFFNGIEGGFNITQLITQTGAVGQPVGIALVPEQGTWYALVANNDASFAVLNLGVNANSNTPRGRRILPFGGIGTTLALAAAKEGSKWSVFVPRNQGTNYSLLRYDFPDSCNAVIPADSSYQPANPIYTRNGKYYVQLASRFADGTQLLALDSVLVKAAPVVNFTNETACQGEFATFNDSSRTAQGTLSSWFWRFGSLGAGTGNSTQFRFLNAGTVPVTLEVTNSVGCRDSIVKNVTVYPRPVAQFSSSINCFGQPVTFTNTSTSAQGAIVFQTWDFGNGATSFDVSPTYTYPEGGTYAVKLTVFTEFGCQDSSVAQVVVPNLDFNTRFTCLGDSTVFTATTFYPTTNVNTLIWNFGDGAMIVGPSVTKHRYAATGTYRVRLTAVTQNGCTDTISKLIVVETPPSLQVETVGVACQTAPVRFRAVSPAAPTASYLWNFGDPASGASNSSTLPEPEHIFSTGATTYQATLQFTTANGCELTEALTVNLQPRPVAGFNLPDTLCLNERYTATSTATTPQGNIVEHLYTLGDGRFTALANPPIRYSTPGSYSFSQVVTNTAGCTDTLRKTLTVVPVPVAGFTVNTRSGFSPLRVVFTNTSTNATRYVWDMGRYGTFTTPDVTLDSVLRGQLVVRLTAYASSNCYSVFQDTITVDTLVPRTYNIIVESVDTALRGRNVEVSARLRNASDTVVSSLRIRVRLNEDPELETYWSGQVAAGATFTYVFPVRLAFNPALTHQIVCLTADRPNTGVDVNPADNQLCRSLGDNIYFAQPKPNPTDDLLNIEVVLPKAGRVDVKIYDALGNHVPPSFGFDGVVGSNAYALDVRHLAGGIYTVVMEVDNARFEARFLKQ